MENKESLMNDLHLVLSMMVLIRWAMVRIVQSAKLSLIVSWMSASVSKSIAAVASSSTSTLVFRSKAPGQADELPLANTAKSRRRYIAHPSDLEGQIALYKLEHHQTCT